MENSVLLEKVNDLTTKVDACSLLFDNLVELCGVQPIGSEDLVKTTRMITRFKKDIDSCKIVLANNNFEELDENAKNLLISKIEETEKDYEELAKYTKNYIDFTNYRISVNETVNQNDIITYIKNAELLMKAVRKDSKVLKGIVSPVEEKKDDTVVEQPEKNDVVSPVEEDNNKKDDTYTPDFVIVPTAVVPAQSKEIVPTDNRRQVITVEPATEETHKKSIGIGAKIAAWGVLAFATLIVLASLKGCSKKEEATVVVTTPTPRPTPTSTVIPDVKPIIDVNDEAKLDEYSKYIQDELKKQAIIMDINDIKNAIKLVNVDLLEEQPFASREEVYNATEDAGNIARNLGCTSILAEDPTDNKNLITERTLDDMIANVTPGFDKTKLNITKYANGYSIYELLDVLVKGINDSNLSNTEREAYAKLLNEVAARKTRSMSLTPNSTVGQHYLVMGLYNAEGQELDELTAGKGYGPCYGDGKEIDNSYGFICVEELRNYMRVGNLDNAYYDYVADLMISEEKALGLGK